MFDRPQLRWRIVGIPLGEYVTHRSASTGCRAATGGPRNSIVALCAISSPPITFGHHGQDTLGALRQSHSIKRQYLRRDSSEQRSHLCRAGFPHSVHNRSGRTLHTKPKDFKVCRTSKHQRFGILDSSVLWE